LGQHNRGQSRRDNRLNQAESKVRQEASPNSLAAKVASLPLKKYHGGY
jgi:hypothetical protein